jgi:protein-tyrosine-phosphatase
MSAEIDREQWVHSTVQRLAAEFAAYLDMATVERYVREALGALDRAPVRAHLPVLVHRFARERLLALAQAEGLRPKPRPVVLFVCVQNAGRSQMAAALTQQLGRGQVEVRSAGSAPAAELHPAVVAAMREIGIDLAEAFPKPLTAEVARAADVVVSMGCGDSCPVYPGQRHEVWEIDDPAGQPLERVRAIRDALRVRVEQLLRSLGVAVVA